MISCFLILSAMTSTTFEVKEIRSLHPTSNVELFGRATIDTAYAQINREGVKVTGEKCVDWKPLLIRARLLNMNKRGGIDLLSQSTSNTSNTEHRDDPHNFLVAEGIVDKIDQFLITSHAVVDTASGVALDFKESLIVGGSPELGGTDVKLALLVSVGDHYEIQEITLTGSMRVRTYAQLRLIGERPESLACFQGGYLVASIYQNDQDTLHYVSQAGMKVELVSRAYRSAIGLQDNEGRRRHSAVSFELGQRFLWATQNALFSGKLIVK